MLRRAKNLWDYANVPDKDVETWLEQAKDGDAKALDHLRCWAYCTAVKYLGIRARGERLLSTYDIEEMASSFFVEFDGSWPRIRSATHYTRFLLSTWIARYRKKRRVEEDREISFDDVKALSESPGSCVWWEWDDERWARFQAMWLTFQAQDPCTKAVVEGRLTVPPVPYQSLSTQLDSTETALRMRMTRFQKAVRENYNQLRRDRIPPLLGRPALSPTDGE